MSLLETEPHPKKAHLDVPLEVGKRLGSVDYNPNISHSWVGDMLHLLPIDPNIQRDILVPNISPSKTVQGSHEGKMH